jgi:hypothetical protein
MAGGSQQKLTRTEVETFLARLREEMPRPECWSCECTQGFLAQLEFDAAEDAKPLLAEHRTTAGETHRCLGCEPCPPADIYAEYLLRRRNQ